MSWVYWLPKSRTRIIRALSSYAALRAAPPSLFESVVGCFLGDDHVVGVALAHAGGADAEELGLCTEVVERPAAAVAHSRFQSAHELVNVECEAAFVRH